MSLLATSQLVGWYKYHQLIFSHERGGTGSCKHQSRCTMIMLTADEDDDNNSNSNNQDEDDDQADGLFAKLHRSNSDQDEDVERMRHC